MTKRRSSVSILVAFVATLVLLTLSSCGGGEVLPPSTALEAKIAYDQAPKMLVNYFGNESINPDTIVTKSQVAPTYPIHASVVYKGKEIYGGASAGGYYTNLSVSHGFALDGAYVIVVKEDYTTYLFVNGKPIPFERRSMGIDIRDSGNGWWLIVFSDGGLQDPFPATESMAILDKKTGELTEFGVAPL